jgi:hypothetical protein
LGLALGTGAADADPRIERHRALVERADRAGDSVVDRCLTCHGSLVEALPHASSPAGLPARQASAWYQRVATYSGAQQNFHWRHLLSPFARQVMRAECDTCHPGFDPRKPMPAGDDPRSRRPLRKRVDPALCINCHGAFPDHREAFTGTWEVACDEFDNTCLVCHRGDAARNHGHPLLDREGILKRVQQDPDVCYGCHGGRAWYAVDAKAIRGSAFDWRTPGLVAPPPAGKARTIIR